MSRAKTDGRTGSHPMLARAREVLELEARGILHVRGRLGMGFVRAVELMAEGPGRVIVCGIGKSGIIARKISATLNSTGTPSFSCTRSRPPTAIWDRPGAGISCWRSRTAARPGS